MHELRLEYSIVHEISILILLNKSCCGDARPREKDVMRAPLGRDRPGAAMSSGDELN